LPNAAGLNLKMRNAIAVSILLVMSAASASAQQPSSETEKAKLSASYDSCMEKSEGVTSKMLDCTGEEFRRQDARLNTAYRRAMSSFSSENREALKEAQRAWIKYRDTSCSLLQGVEGGGTLATVAEADCILGITAERARWIESLLEY